MKHALFTVLSEGINAYLMLDPLSSARLALLTDKTIIVRLLPFQLAIHLHCQRERIDISESSCSHVDSADAIITGTPLQLVGVAINKQDRQRFFAEDIQIEGDVEAAQKIIELFDDMSIDWEEMLSVWVGDAPALKAGKLYQSMKQWALNARGTFAKNLNEYLHEEINFFPTYEALKNFYDEIDKLNMDTERLMVKVNLLKEKIVERESP